MQVGVTRTVPALLVFALALALAPRPASAQERLALRWTAPPACPDGAVVRDEVERLLGGAIPDGARVTAEADATARGSRYRLTLATEMEGAHGERVLEAERCAELAAATALILALMIDPEAVARAEPSPLITGTQPPPIEPAERAATQAAATSLTPASLATALASPRMESTLESTRGSTETTTLAGAEIGSAGIGSAERRTSSRDAPDRAVTAAAPGAEDALGGFVGAVGLLDVGTLPAPTAGVAVEAGFGVPLVDGRLRATFLFPQPGDSAEVPGVGADLMAASLGARGCVRPIEEARLLGGCVGLAAGAVFGSGRGVADPQSGIGFWLAGSVGLALAWAPVEWFDLELDADLVIPFYDSNFVVDLAGRAVDVFVPSDVAGRFGLAAHVRFR